MHAVRVLKMASVPIWEGWQGPGDLTQTRKYQSQFLFSFLYLIFVFYWESDFIHLLPKHNGLTPDEIRKPAWCFRDWQYKDVVHCAGGISVTFLSATPLLLPLNSARPRRALHPQSHRPIGSSGFRSRRHLRGCSVPPIYLRKPKGNVICPWAWIEMWRTRTGDVKTPSRCHRDAQC